MGNAKQAIELALLTQRCQDHLLSNILQSVKQRDERGHLQYPRKKQEKKNFLAFKCAAYDLKSKKALCRYKLY